MHLMHLFRSCDYIFCCSISPYPCFHPMPTLVIPSLVSRHARGAPGPFSGLRSWRDRRNTKDRQRSNRTWRAKGLYCFESTWFYTPNNTESQERVNIQWNKHNIQCTLIPWRSHWTATRAGIASLPIGIVIRDGIDHVLVSLESEQLFPRHRVPHLTGSIVASSDKTTKRGRYFYY